MKTFQMLEGAEDTRISFRLMNGHEINPGLSDSSSTTTSLTDLKTVVLKLLAYCQAEEWKGYDPYDALNSEIFKRLPFLNSRIPRILLTQLFKRSPLNLRPLFRIPKTQNPKALALFLMAFVRLSRIGLLDREELIKTMVDKLMAPPIGQHSLLVLGV